ncbi:MAG: DUF1015 family protein, partial [Silvibacterium sp.]
ALQYAREHAPGETILPQERNPDFVPQPPYAEAAAMMTFINMDGEGLVILPTHRVVHGLADFAPSSFIEKLQPYFTVEPLAMDDADALTARLREAQGKTAFVAVTSAGRYLITTIPEVAKAALQEIPARQRDLDIVQLHALILEKILGINPEAIRQQTNVRYVRDAAEAIDQVARNEANVAFLMNPVTLDELREVAFAGEVMPQKSTDFFPKLLSGLTIYALD